MSFLSIIIALLLEQVRPIGRHHPLRVALPEFIQAVRSNFDAGQRRHAYWVWILLVLVPTLCAFLLHLLITHFLGWIAALVFNIAILYLTLGFRQFSFHVTGIRKALEAGDQVLARQLLAQWRKTDTRDFGRGSVIQLLIEASVLATHISVFGVIFWYAIFAAFGLGPAGAIFYRLSEFCNRYIQSQNQSPELKNSYTATFFLKMWAWVDLPTSRLTALSFAMVGNFEEVITRWRDLVTDAPWPNASQNDNMVIAAATAGLQGTSPLGADLHPQNEISDFPIDAKPPPRIEPTLGLAEINWVVGLIWRALILWVLVMGLLTIARLMG